jgi:hypothetical protein
VPGRLLVMHWEMCVTGAFLAQNCFRETGVFIGPAVNDSWHTASDI